jgi:internalin A
LNSLYLGFNQIQGISFLKDLKSLNTLYLSDNQIQDISFLKDLKSLNTLYLSDNQIQDYSFLKDLKSLNSLYLSNNQIQDISFLKDLESLNTLDLRSNQIQDIQPLLFLIKKGISVKWEDYSERSVMLYSNPISNPPIEIVKEGNEAILNYFAELDKQGEVPLYEAKMLIIGESGAGKTTLARKLQNVTADIPQENETTKGIDIHRLDFKTEEEHGFRINMWDFGGQEIYHATHQFFLTKRSLYVLVTDNRKEDTDFNYWLQTVELLGGKSPILIIQNEKSERTKDINIKGMKAQYSELKDSFSTNLFTNKGLDKIEKAVRYHIQSLPLVGQMLPKQWVNIRNALEALEESGVPYISLERYYQICADHEIKEEKRALFLAQYLHDLGVFLHFQKDMLLRKTIVLQNEWATDAVYQVLDCKAVIEKHGQFDEADLATIWAASEYKNMHAELLKLMETFEMCYKITDSNQYLAPQLLPASAPDDYTWDEKENLILRLKYDFLPKGLVSRLMVRNHHLIKDIKQSWKSGVVFEYQETKAEVVELYGQGEIVIRVKGNRCRDLMTIIVKDFEQLHSKYEDIKVEKLIPCHCQQCISKKQKEKYYFSFTVLQNAEQKNINKIQCQKSFDEVEVQRLINDTFIADKIRKAERDRLNYIQEEKDNSITINNIINQPTMPESKPTPSSPEPSSIWAYASIFIIVMAVLLAALSILSIVKSLILITGGILFITLLATLQLQNDSRIKETNFMKLMTMVLKKIPPISFFVKKEK